MAAMTWQLQSRGGNKSYKKRRAHVCLCASTIASTRSWSHLLWHVLRKWFSINANPEDGCVMWRSIQVKRGAHLVNSSSSCAWSGGKNFTANLRIVCFGPSVVMITQKYMTFCLVVRKHSIISSHVTKEKDSLKEDVTAFWHTHVWAAW